MTTLHQTTLAQRIARTTQRIFRPLHTGNLLVPARIDAHTARDIGVNLNGSR